jgi:ferric-dicitrate binding protein FerR (iron transport regulator)
MGEVMTKPRVESSAREPDPVEALLSRAQPRPAPPAEHEQQVRDAVYAQWRGAAARRLSRRRVLQFAAAASVLLAVAAGFNLYRDSGVAPAEIATISKSHGSVYLIGERSELRELPSIDTVLAGQTMVTGSDAGIGLDWHGGGSLRVDADTTVEFLSADSIHLRQGRVYFDSRVEHGAAALTISTAHGDLTHVGTQYMAAVDTLTLVVSVREGAVTISRRGGDDRAAAGQRLEFAGDARPLVSNISRTGSQWAWIEATAPTLDFSGRSTYEFLQWVGRETGYSVEFESAEADRLARDGRLVGTIPGLDPRGELEVRMLGEDLDYAFDEVRGTLNIRTAEPGS